ncbi:MAG TPA: D-aminoacyl-tRNA deacylase [Chloroflexota bacterium]|nr:D-aminoacyl-tRNA deacylase [Chloroflexota bacterium]
MPGRLSKVARVVVQRVRSASVQVNGEIVGRIGLGFLLFVGIAREDTAADVDRLVEKVAVLRVFRDNAGKMNLAAPDVGGSMLVVSQFTLYADTRKGRRPSFVQAADPADGERLVERFAARLAQLGFPVEQGRFGADMLVTLENDGPVTIILDSETL